MIRNMYIHGEKWIFKYVTSILYIQFNRLIRISQILQLNMYLLSKSESVKFSLIESEICLFTESSVETIFFTVKSVNFHCLISENNIFHC